MSVYFKMSFWLQNFFQKSNEILGNVIVWKELIGSPAVVDLQAISDPWPGWER